MPKKTETLWPADRVERRPIEGADPYARNARTHSDAQIVIAARKLKITEVPVMIAEADIMP